ALYVAWEKNWLGIRDATKAGVDFVAAQFERLKQWWDESEIGQTVRERIEEIRQVLEQDLAPGEKAREIIRITFGIDAENPIYQAIKHGVATGDWAPLWETSRQQWEENGPSLSVGVILAIGRVYNAIKKGLD